MPGHTHQKRYYQFINNCEAPLYIAKILQACYFGFFGNVWLWRVKCILTAYRKLWSLSSCKKIEFHPHFFFEILQKYCKLFYFGYFGQAWPNLLLGNSDVSLQTKNQLHPNFFNSYYTLKNPAIWLAKNILGKNSRTTILPDTGFAMES